MGIKAEPTFALKDQLFNKELVTVFAKRIAGAEPSFSHHKFVAAVMKRFPDLELKQRMDAMVEALETQLPDDISASRKVLLAALPEPLDPCRTDNDFGDFVWMVPGEFVAKHGCTEKETRASLEFLRESTKRASAEFALRPFLKSFPEVALPLVASFAKDKNYHVRRLASEGTRPYLPWGQRVILPLEEVIGILDVLHADKTRYVTRSVANSLNDLSKIDPSLVVQTLQRWKESKKQLAGELDWMERHGLRTLLKKSHPEALAMRGYPLDPSFQITQLKFDKAVQVGEDFRWQCTLKSEREQKLRIQLRVSFLKANGSLSAKIFALKDAAFSEGGTVTLEKKISFRAQTTRTLYPGKHAASLVVNGVVGKEHAFELQV